MSGKGSHVYSNTCGEFGSSRQGLGVALLGIAVAMSQKVAQLGVLGQAWWQWLLRDTCLSQQENSSTTWEGSWRSAWSASAASEDYLKVWRDEKTPSWICPNKQLMLWSVIIREKEKKKKGSGGKKINTLFSICYVNGRLGWPTVHNLAKQLIPNFNIYIWLLLQKRSAKTKHRRAHNRHPWTLKP